MLPHGVKLTFFFLFFFLGYYYTINIMYWHQVFCDTHMRRNVLQLCAPMQLYSPRRTYKLGAMYNTHALTTCRTSTSVHRRGLLGAGNIGTALPHEYIS